MLRIAIFIALLCLLCPVQAIPWSGYDYKRGTFIEIEKGNLVRPGKEIEYYDYEKGEYRYGEVESMQRNGSSVEIEVNDYDTGETSTFDMD